MDALVQALKEAQAERKDLPALLKKARRAEHAVNPQIRQTFSKTGYSSNSACFPKAARFQNINQKSNNKSQRDLDWNLNAVKPAPSTAAIGTEKRWKPKPSADGNLEIHPNYKLVKKAVPAAIIPKPKTAQKMSFNAGPQTNQNIEADAKGRRKRPTTTKYNVRKALNENNKLILSVTPTKLNSVKEIKDFKKNTKKAEKEQIIVDISARTNPMHASTSSKDFHSAPKPRNYHSTRYQGFGMNLFLDHEGISPRPKSVDPAAKGRRHPLTPNGKRNFGRAKSVEASHQKKKFLLGSPGLNIEEAQIHAKMAKFQSQILKNESKTMSVVGYNITTPNSTSPIAFPKSNLEDSEFSSQKKKVKITLPNSGEKEKVVDSEVASEEDDDFGGFFKAKNEWFQEIQLWNKEHPEIADLSTSPSTTTHFPSKSSPFSNRKKSCPGSVKKISRKAHQIAPPPDYDSMFHAIERSSKFYSFGREVRRNNLFKTPEKKKQISAEDSSPEKLSPSIDKENKDTQNKKASTFEEPPIQDINPNYDAIKPRHMTTKIAMPQPPTEQIKLKKLQKEEEEQIRAHYEKSKNIDDMDKLMKYKINVPTLGRPREDPFKSVKSRFISRDQLILGLKHLAEWREKISRAPTDYKPKHEPIEPQIHTKIMHSPEKNKPTRSPRHYRKPGPASYIPKSTLIQDRQPEYSFGNIEGRDDSIEEDRRRALSPSYNLTKKKVPAAIIQAEKEILESEYFRKQMERKMGPGKYEPEFVAVEKRADVGVLKMKDPPEPIKEEEDLREIYPNFDFDKPNKLVFQYYEKLRINPPHLPVKELLKENWRFYDSNVANIKDRPTEIDFANGIPYEQYLQYEQEKAKFLRFIHRNERNPEIGHYDPLDIDTKIPIDFSKKVPRDPNMGIDDQDLFDRNGDILFLNPDKPKQHLAQYDMGKQVGRKVHENVFEDDELIIEPHITAIKKRPKMFVDMYKQIGRNKEEEKNLNETEIYIHNQYLPAELSDPSKPKIKAFNFGKGRERFAGSVDNERDEMILDPKYDYISK